MAGRSISYIYSILDRYSPALAKMSRSAQLFSAKSKYMNETISKAQDKIRNFGQSVKTNFIRMLKVGAVGAVAGAGVAITSFIKQASMIEDAVAGFTPLMGSTQKAEQLVDALNQTAATTPFQFENISAAAKQLLPVMNGNIENTIDTFRMLGDTAGGNAQKLDSITRGFMKSMLKGKVDMESLNMIAEAGVPIYSELAGSMGVSVAKMMEMSSEGKITSNDLQKAFQNMTSEGGIFYKGMEIASMTLTGRLSTLKDNISLTAASIGKTLLPIVKPLIDNAIKAAGKIREWVDANQELINEKVTGFLSGMGKAISTVSNVIKILLPFLTPLIAAFIGYKAVMMVLEGITLAAAAAQMIMNAAMNANPVGLVVAGIAALIAIIVLLVKHWDTVKEKMLSVWGVIKTFVTNATNKFMELLDNPFFTAIATIFAPWLTIPALIIKNWQPIMDFFTMLGEKIGAGVEKVKGFFGKVGEIIGVGEGSGTESTTPHSYRTDQAPMPGQGAYGGANATASVSVYTERGMNVTPFVKQGNLGYNMTDSYSRGM